MALFMVLGTHASEVYLDDLLDEIDWSEYSFFEVNELALLAEKRQREQDFYYLFAAKNHLINGNIKASKFYLEKIKDTSSKLILVKARYLSLLSFLEGDYNLSLNYIRAPHFDDGKYYKHICLLRVMNLMALKDLKKLEYEGTNCLAVTSDYSINSQLWPSSLVDLRLKKAQALKGGVLQNSQFILNEPEYLRVWLKLALFLNREDLVLGALNDLPPSSYQSNRIREMVGMIHYRLGNKKRALEFIEDIKSSNAENIKGNINLENKEYELAYGHYQLALKYRSNSQNAIERSLPLTWLLGQWDEGRELIKRVHQEGVDQKKRLALDSAFQMRLGQNIKAYEQMELLRKMYMGKLPVELEIMATYSALMGPSTSRKLEIYSQEACTHFDGISCWVYLQQTLWPKLDKAMKSNTKLELPPEDQVESLKSAQAITPLDEPLLIDSKDIDDLDAKKAKLIF